MVNDSFPASLAENVILLYTLFVFSQSIKNIETPSYANSMHEPDTVTPC